MFDELVALWRRLTDGLMRLPPGQALGAWLGRFRPAPPVADGYYITVATRFDMGRLRNQMRSYSPRGPLRSLKGMLRRWRVSPQSYQILKRAAGGICVEPYLGSVVFMPLTDATGEAILSGRKKWTSVTDEELATPPARHIYVQFGEALDKQHRQILFRYMMIKFFELATEDAWYIARPVTDVALYFYQHRGFTRLDGSPPLLDQICFTNVGQNPKALALKRAIRGSSNV